MKTKKYQPKRRKRIDYKKEFKIEMDAKNQAYYFILSNGLFDAFYLFCRTHDTSNPHDKCISVLCKEV